MTIAARTVLPSYPLRIPVSIRHKANDLAHQEGISLNHFISIAIAEKISRNEQAYVLLSRMRQGATAAAAPTSRWQPRKLI